MNLKLNPMKNLILFLKKRGIYLLAAFFLSSLQGCKFYYEAQTVKPVTAPEIGKYALENKYFILHQETKFWHLSGIEVNEESLAGNLSADVPEERWGYEITDSKRSHRYITYDRIFVLDQVHLYLKDSAAPEIDSSGHIKVALTDIKTIDVYQKDKGRTLASWLIPAIAIPLAIFVLIAASMNSGGGGEGSIL
jgi:hypothetical protein